MYTERNGKEEGGGGVEKYRAVSGHNTAKGRKQWEGGKGACQGLLLTSAYRQVTVSPA
jgi:hypothetical protein